MRLLLIAALLMPCLTSAANTYPADFICGGVIDQNQKQECVEKAQLFLDREDRPVKETPIWVSWIWPVSWWLVYYAFGLIIALYIYQDAKKRDWVFLGIRPIWWTVLVLFDPALGILAYWAVHYSKLAQTYSEATAQRSKP